MYAEYRSGEVEIGFDNFSSDGVDILKRRLGRFTITDEDLKISAVRNAAILPPVPQPNKNYLGGVFDAEGRPVPDAQLRRLGHVLLGDAPGSSPAPLRTLAAALYGGLVISAYGHLILESLCRLWAASAMPGLPIVFQVARPASDLTNLMTNLAGLLGISADRLLFVAEPIAVEELWVPAPGLELSTSINLRYIDFVRRAVSRQISCVAPLLLDRTQPHGIYLSRSKLSSGKRRAIGEDALESRLESQGMACLWPERLPVNQQMCMVNNFDRFAGFIGSQFHNIIFRNSRSNLDIVYFCSDRPSPNFLQLDLLFPGRRLYSRAVTFDPLWEFGARAPLRIDRSRVFAALKSLDMIDGTTADPELSTADDLAEYTYHWFYNWVLFNLVRRYRTHAKTSGVEAGKAAMSEAAQALLARLGDDRHRFRATLLEAYDNVCAHCGFDGPTFAPEVRAAFAGSPDGTSRNS